MNERTEQIECPICYEEITQVSNAVMTECGHKFHCRCLMQHSAHNGYSCPCCRSQMVEKVIEEDTNSFYSDDDDNDDEFNEDYACLGLRLFINRLNCHSHSKEDVMLEHGYNQMLSREMVEKMERQKEQEIAFNSYKEFSLNHLIKKNISYDDLVKYVLSLQLQHLQNEEDEDKDLIVNKNVNLLWGKFEACLNEYTKTHEPMYQPHSSRVHYIDESDEANEG